MVGHELSPIYRKTMFMAEKMPRTTSWCGEAGKWTSGGMLEESSRVSTGLEQPPRLGEATGTRSEVEGSFHLVKPIMGETWRARSSSLDLTPMSPISLTRTPSIRELTQRPGARRATIPETSFGG